MVECVSACGGAAGGDRCLVVLLRGEQLLMHGGRGDDIRSCWSADLPLGSQKTGCTSVQCRGSEERPL